MYYAVQIIGQKSWLNIQAFKSIVPSIRFSDGTVVKLNVKLDETSCVILLFGSDFFASRANRKSVRIALQAQ